MVACTQAAAGMVNRRKVPQQGRAVCPTRANRGDRMNTWLATEYCSFVLRHLPATSQSSSAKDAIELQIGDDTSCASALSTLPPSYHPLIQEHPSSNPWKKMDDDEAPSTSAPASRLASPQVSQHLQSPRGEQQSQPVAPWSAHIPPSGQWPSPFPRFGHAISTTATAAGELFLFGGFSDGRSRGDLYVISTRDLSTTLLKTSGDVPSPRSGHCAVLTSTILLIWGGGENLQHSDDSFYLLNLGTSDLFHVKTCSS
jgi:hypothetical protein